jgi:hypothetical protein
MEAQCLVIDMGRLVYHGAKVLRSTFVLPAGADVDEGNRGEVRRLLMFWLLHVGCVLAVAGR